MQCQSDIIPSNMDAPMDIVCTSSNTTTFPQNEALTMANPTTVMDQNALSFMSKLFPDIPGIYSHAFAKANLLSPAMQTDPNGPPAPVGQFPHPPPLSGDTTVPPTGLLPFGPFSLPVGMGNLAFVSNPLGPTGEQLPLLACSRNAQNLLNSNPTSMAGETLKAESTSPSLPSSTTVNNNNHNNNNNNTEPVMSPLDPGLHMAKNMSVNSMSEIANLLQLSNMSSMPYPTFTGMDNLSKSKASTYSAAQSATQTGKTDEDFCELCQKHFCNKYYLRKHKADVHGIHTEPYSHSRRRESLNASTQKHGPVAPQTLPMGMERSGCLPSNITMRSNSSTPKTAGLNKFGHSGDSVDAFGSELIASAMTGLSNSNAAERMSAENGGSNNLLFPSLPMGAQPMDYTSVLKETFMLNALQSKIPTTSSNQSMGSTFHPGLSATGSTASGVPIPVNGMDSMLSAHYYMIALMSSLTPGLNNELSNSVENTPPQMDKNSITDMFSSLSHLESSSGGIREVQCDQCHKVFCNQYFLQVHKANQHNPSNDPAREPHSLTNAGESKDDRLSTSERVDNANEYARLAEMEMQSYLASQGAHLPAAIDRHQPSGNPLNSPTPTSTSSTSHSTVNKSDSKAVANSLDVFKSSMVAAKLADRVTCEFCKKELCNKYFLRTHKIRVHGVSPKDVGGPPMRNPPAVSTTANHHHSQQQQPTASSIASYQTSGPIFPIPDSTRLSTGQSVMNLTANATEASIQGKTDSSNGGLFGTLPVGISAPHLPNPLLALPYWSMLTQSVPESNPSNSSVAAPSSSTNTITTGSGMGHLNTPTSGVGLGEVPALLPLGLSGAENLSATAVISCPMCEQSIGPRLFLPSHLTTVHGLNPLDPAFFLNMLRAKVITMPGAETGKAMVNGLDHQTETTKKSQSKLPGSADSIMPTLVQEEVEEEANNDNDEETGTEVEKENTGSNVTSGMSTSNNPVKPLAAPFYGCQVTPDQFVHTPPEKTAVKPVGMTVPAEGPHNADFNTPEEGIVQGVLTSSAPNPDTIVVSTVSDVGMNQCNSGGSTASSNSDSRNSPNIVHPINSTETTTSSSLIPFSNGVPSTTGVAGFPGSPNTSMTAAAVAAATAFSNFPMNPIEAVMAAMAAATGGQWNPSGAHSGATTGLYPGPPSTATLSSSSASPILGVVATSTGAGGGVSGTAGGSGLIPSSTSGMPRKSPNQMRVLCDICNKWICNKYFLRTHRANKHGITDTSSSTSSMDGYKSKLHTSRSQSCFRRSIVPMTDEFQTMPSPDTVESNSQGPSISLRMGDRPRSPKNPSLVPMDTGMDTDKLDSQEKFLQAWKMAYEAGSQTGRDNLGATCPFPMPGPLPPFINPAMMMPGFPSAPVMTPFSATIGSTASIPPQLNYMIPFPHGLDSPLNMGKSMEVDNTRAQNGPMQSEPDESSDMLTKSMIQSISPVDEKHAEMKLHLPLNLSLKPSSTPLKKRHVKSTSADDMAPRPAHTNHHSGSKRYLILGHLRRAKRFCLHSVWRKQQNQTNKQLARFAPMGPGGQSKKNSPKECPKQPNAIQTGILMGGLKSANRSMLTNTYDHPGLTMTSADNLNGSQAATGSQGNCGFDTILSCPLCLPTNTVKFTTLNSLLQHISLIHGGSAQNIYSNGSKDCSSDGVVVTHSKSAFPYAIPTNTTATNNCSPTSINMQPDPSGQPFSHPFHVQELASSNSYANQDCKSHNFSTVDSKQPTESSSNSVGISESGFESPDPSAPTSSTSTVSSASMVQNNNNSSNSSSNNGGSSHLHSIPVSVTLHRPVFIPVNSYTETLSSM